jgi:hypothetical protein
MKPLKNTDVMPPPRGEQLADGWISPRATDTDVILDHIDEGYGVPEAVRYYIYALRDLQYFHDSSSFDPKDLPDIYGKGTPAKYPDHHQAKARVAKAFRRLVSCHRDMVANNLRG